ncbi:MAG: B12-binding domain-containing radical SAM protein [Desulfobacteraceae bacterium]
MTTAAPKTSAGKKEPETILLVNPPHFEKQKAGEGEYVSPGIVLIGTVLKNAGYEVKLIDGSLDADYQDDFFDILKDRTPKVIGFSVMTSQVTRAYELTQKAKAMDPDINIVWGGFHPTIFPEQTIADPHIDYVVVGEGINVIVPLVQYILGEHKNIADVPGIYYRDSNNTIQHNDKPPLAQFDQIPDIDWDLYDQACLERALGKNLLREPARVLPIVAGLGCNFRCTFCFNAIFKIPHRRMSAERIYANMKRMKEQYGLNEIIFYDENFFADQDRILRLIELLEQEPLDLKFFSTMRASDVRRKYYQGDFLQRFRKVGGYNIGIGAESGNQGTLDRLKKGIKVQDIIEMAKVGRDNNIIMTFSFMAGLPGEQIEEVFDTFDLIRKIKAIDPCHFIIGPQIFRPYPGSKLFDEAVKKGLQIPDTLKGWTDNRMITYLTVVDKNYLPWISNIDTFERIMRSYNIGYLARLDVLQQYFYYEYIKNERLRKISDKFIEFVVKLTKWRLEKRHMKHMIEAPISRYLESAYFS